MERTKVGISLCFAGLLATDEVVSQLTELLGETAFELESSDLEWGHNNKCGRISWLPYSPAPEGTVVVETYDLDDEEHFCAVNSALAAQFDAAVHAHWAWDSLHSKWEHKEGLQLALPTPVESEGRWDFRRLHHGGFAVTFHPKEGDSQRWRTDGKDGWVLDPNYPF